MRLHKRGFTLVEVIVILVVLAVIAAILIPAMTGWIDDARKKSVVINCKICVTAAQTLASEQYIEVGAGGVLLDEADVLALARVDGSVDSVTVAVPAEIDELTYTDKTGDVTVTYYRKPQPHYEFGASFGSSLAGLVTAFGKAQSGALTDGNGKSFSGSKIDGVNVNVEGSFAKAMFDSLSASQQAFLSSVSWSIVKTKTQDGTTAYRIYFTQTHYGATDSATGVKVYKYDMATGKYQYTTGGKVNNGMVTSTGTTWSEWSDTMD